MRERVAIALLTGSLFFSFAAACGGSARTSPGDGSGGFGFGGNAAAAGAGAGMNPGTGGTAGTGLGPGTGGTGMGPGVGGSGGVPATCGNGTLDANELCDGTELGGETCASATMGAASEGTLACTASCTFDLSGCSGPGTGGAGGAGGGGGMGGMGVGGTGGGGTCNPAFCPPATFGTTCCITPNGPCGIDVGMGCMPQMSGDGGP